MSLDPYANNLLDVEMPCADKTPVVGRLCCILHARAEQRGLQLATFPSRAVQQHEIHELILTAEERAEPGREINRIAYLGFFEILVGGVLWSGDRVEIGERCVGTLAGYDLTHFPNHLNIVVCAGEPVSTGLEFGFHLGDSVTFIFPKKESRG